jgi:quinolinate synthase
MDKKVKVIKYQDHPELENKVVEYSIIDNKKIKPIVKKKKEPKQSKMTINQLAGIVNQLASTVNDLTIEMRAGFVAVNQRMNRIENDVSDIKKTLKRHDEIFERNNLK